MDPLMTSTRLLVKNMVCHRCVLTIESILSRAGISFKKIIFGEIELAAEISQAEKVTLTGNLQAVGFELFDDHGRGIIERMKHLIIKKARNEVDEKTAASKLSHYLSSNVNYEYTYLSSLFSAMEGRTIEHYFITQRIEKAKELLVYDQLSLSQIAFDLDYSSVAHLSAQFKKVTGLTPTFFKELGASKRRSIDII